MFARFRIERAQAPSSADAALRAHRVQARSHRDVGGAAGHRARVGRRAQRPRGAAGVARARAARARRAAIVARARARPDSLRVGRPPTVARPYSTQTWWRRATDRDPLGRQRSPALTALRPLADRRFITARIRGLGSNPGRSRQRLGNNASVWSVSCFERRDCARPPLCKYIYPDTLMIRKQVSKVKGRSGYLFPILRPPGGQR